MLGESLTQHSVVMAPTATSPTALFSSTHRSTVLERILAPQWPQMSVAFVPLRHAAPEEWLVFSGFIVYLDINRCFPGLSMIPKVTVSRPLEAQLFA